MKKLLTIFRTALGALLAAAFLVACTPDASDNPAPSAFGAGEGDPMAVSLDQALDEMHSLMGEIYGPATRAGSRTIGRVATFKTSGGATRSGEAPVNLAWVVNFDQGGFAVLGARTTLPGVLCIADGGDFTADEVDLIAREIAMQDNEAMPQWKSYEQIHYSNPENEGEDFDITDYNADEEDDLEGAEDEGQIEDEGEYLIGAGTTDVPRFVKKTVLEYALCKDGEQRQRAGAGKRIRRTTTAKQQAATIPADYTGVSYGDWEDFAKSGPFVVTMWNQSYPYNMYCPIDRTDNIHNSYTGCVATSLSQIIAFNEKPAPWKIDKSVTSTWAEIKGHYFNPSKAAVRTVADTRIESDMAKIVHAIGKGVDMNYSYYNGSAASSANAKKYVKKNKYPIQYNKVRKKIRYKMAHIELMMGRGLPMYISAAGAGGAHAWVLDGTVRQRREIDTYVSGVITARTTETRNLIHCNYGWGGIADGYYYSEMFDPSQGPAHTESGIDPANSGTNGRHYNRQYQLIIYDR